MGMWANSGQWEKRGSLLNGVGTGAGKYFLHPQWKPQEAMVSCPALKVVMSLWLPELPQPHCYRPEDGANSEGRQSIVELLNQRHYISLLFKATWGGISETYVWKHPIYCTYPYSATKLKEACLLSTHPSEDAKFLRSIMLHQTSRVGLCQLVHCSNPHI